MSVLFRILADRSQRHTQLNKNQIHVNDRPVDTTSFVPSPKISLSPDRYTLPHTLIHKPHTHFMTKQVNHFLSLNVLNANEKSHLFIFSRHESASVYFCHFYFYSFYFILNCLILFVTLFWTFEFFIFLLSNK